MDDQEVLNFFPVLYEVQANHCYRWCGCSLTQTPPFCDRTDCGQQCVAYQAEYTDTVAFCGCKKTKTPPFCDGSHAELLKEYLKKRNK